MDRKKDYMHLWCLDGIACGLHGGYILSCVDIPLTELMKCSGIKLKTSPTHIISPSFA
jgi:hypothetical protein